MTPSFPQTFPSANTGPRARHPKFCTMIESLRFRAQWQKGAPAFAFMKNGDVEVERLTFDSLDERARRIALAARALASPGERIVLVYSPGLDFVSALFGCLYAGIIVVPVGPPRRDHFRDKLVSIARDCSPRGILTDRFCVDKLLEVSRTNLSDLPVVATDSLAAETPPGAEGPWEPLPISGDAIAILQYTSGSTGAPKGVCVTHRNLVANAEMINEGFGHDGSTIMVGWLPLFHDMGLVGCVMQPIYNGFLSALMPPVAFIQRPSRWLRAISRYKATTSGGPNFGYELCVSRFRPEQLEGVDLSSWRVAFNGAEPVRSQTLRRFSETFARFGFQARMHRPCYGLAEATLVVSDGGIGGPPATLRLDAAALEKGKALHVDDAEAQMQGPRDTTQRDDQRAGARVREVVSCGRTIGEQIIRIVDPSSSRRCGEDEIGEVWLRGENISQGYWNKPDATRETFGAIIRDTGEGPFLRTGDTGFLHDDELYITGRIKDIVVLQGRNLYPHDVEAIVQASHPAFQPGGGAAFSVDGETGGRLVIVQEVAREACGISKSVLLATAREAVAAEFDAHLSDLVLLRPGTLPKTSSGKIQRSVCRLLYLSGDFASADGSSAAV